MTDLTRRGFLAASGGALAGTRLSNPVRARAPQVVPDREWRLDVQWIERTLGDRRVRLRSYGGTVPGPLLVGRPGETVRVRVRNYLTPYDSSEWDGNHNVPHELDTTNLHLHGLEIIPHLFEPVGTADPTAAMIAIRPGETKEYLIEIPDDQPSGLFWYHPHRHGSTAVQAVSGMAGGIIIRGPIDEVPEIAAAREFTLALQDIGLFRSALDPSVWEYNPPQNAIWNTGSGMVKDGRTGRQWAPPPGGFSTGDYALRYYLVNGEPYFKEEHNAHTPREPVATQLPAPTYSLRPGEVVRFRILNGNSDNLMPIVVEGHEVHLIALDGVNFPAPRVLPAPRKVQRPEDAQLLLAPGNRAEFLLRASATPGHYRIIQQQQSEQFLHSEQKDIATIVVEGPPRNMDLPTSLPVPTRHYPLIRPDEITARREVTLSALFPGQANPIVGMDFLINGRLYREDTVDAEWITEVDAIEEWTLRVPDGSHGGNEGHPFHIHVNAFEVISVGSVTLPPGTIQDTVWVPQDKTVVIRTHFRQWTGKSVFHCHILPHEDTGMMRNFLIRPRR